VRHVYSGKVRELYQTDDGMLLLVATDRISAFDHVLVTEIPDKGKILTQLSLWWFEQLAGVVPSHVVPSHVVPSDVVPSDVVPSAVVPGHLAGGDVPAEFAGRAMRCRPLRMVPFECVARGYLAGSATAEYARTGAVCGVRLPPGLVEGSRLPEPVFTPATKAPRGEHDQNVSASAVAEQLGGDVAAELERITLEVYRRGAALAADRGIIVADTKIELGFDGDGALLLADEVLTPDSSRFWPAERWQPGHAQPSLDKQYVRDWLTSAESGWDPRGGEPPPPLPAWVVERTRDRYVEAYQRITGLRWR
jgi:phosphoribosylaminoimidazole-succinocarboxamide synthase